MRHLIAFFLAALLAPLCHTADADVREKLLAIDRDITQLFKDKKYDAVAEKCREQLALAPNNFNAEYNLACALARQNKITDALDTLSKAIDHGYTDAMHMNADEDLEILRKEKRFADLTALATEKERSGDYEKGAEIKGIKTIESYPMGGLRYRLRMSETASAAKPNRLIIWLHPSGGSMNNVAESLAPQLAQHGFALLVLTKKEWMGWTGEDAGKLLNVTLPEVAKIPGIAAQKPILLGYSAGGQLALQVWEQNGAKFGGLILDAAYPIDMAKYTRGQAAPIELPKDPGALKVPMFVIVGETDGGSRIWKQCEDNWRKAGVALTTTYIPNKGHTWLFGKTEFDSLLKWLDGL